MATQVLEEAVHRDAGLKREIGVTAFAATIVNGVIGGGIFAAPAALAGSVGAWAPFALLACGIAMGAIVLCCAEAGSRVPSSGGIYAYVEAAFGRGWGFVTGIVLWLSCVLAAAGVAAAFADAIVALWPTEAPAVQRVLLLVGAFGLITAVNLRGVALGARLASLSTVVKLVPLLLFIGVGAFFVEPANLRPAAGVDSGSFGRAMILALFAFSGMETVLGASGEVARPERTVPRALVLAMGIVLLLYLAIQIVAQGLLGAELAGSAEPLAEAIGIASPGLVAVIAIGAALSRGGWLFSDVIGAPRILFAFARDGLLPAPLGRLNGAHVPHVAILTHVSIALTLALIGSFGSLVLLSGLFTVPIYLGACLSAVKLRRLDVRLIGEPYRVPGLIVAAAIGIVSMIALLAGGQWIEIGGLVAAILVSGMIYLVRKDRSSRA
ncbi:APC family permease [Sphingomonas sp. ID1715]|uniref:APC family permease n=1 Tax=Sphingomonas sp. ID1715 TaxID=1656898 RepID=UPI00148897EF|nr:APC family permease [Sphingomonas sp. ID1715]NNM78246.1 APC family permease [Sphingomonas sp. ID1715]